MKKLLVLAAAAAGLTATPAFAADSVQVTATGVVAPLCELALSTPAAVTVRLDTAATQDLAEMTAKCNTPTATATVTSVSFQRFGAFSLQNAAGPRSEAGIPYRLSVAGGGPANQTASFSYDPFNTKNALQFSLASAISQIDTRAGTYTDLITVTIAPNS